MNTHFDEKQSISLINEMIMQARNNFQKGAGNSFLFWGYSIAALAILNFALLHILNNQQYAFWVWALTIPLYIVSALYNKGKEKEAVVKTHIDGIIKYVWIGFFVSNIVFVSTIYTLALGLNKSILFISITPVIMTFTAMALFITAKACRFKPYVYGAYAFWATGIVCVIVTLLTKQGDLQFLLLAAAMVVGFVIPGHIANKKAE